MSFTARSPWPLPFLLLVAPACIYRPETFAPGLGQGDVRATVQVARGESWQNAAGARAALEPGLRRTTTNAEGVFTLRGLPAGPSRVTITAEPDLQDIPAYGLQVPVNIPQRNGVRGALDLGVLRLGRTSTVRGTVRLAVNGACEPGMVPPAGGHVVLDLEERAARWDTAGNFEMAGVVPGEHKAAAANETMASDLLAFTVGADQQVTLEKPLCLLPAAADATLQGSLVTPPDMPEPPLPERVDLLLEGLPAVNMVPQAVSPGGFLVTELQPSIYALRIPLPEPFLPVQLAWLVVPPGGRAVELVAWHADGTGESASSSSSSSSGASSSVAPSSSVMASSSAGTSSSGGMASSQGSSSVGVSSGMGDSSSGPPPVNVLVDVRGYSGTPYVAPGETRLWNGWSLTADDTVHFNAVRMTVPAVTGTLRIYQDAEVPEFGATEALQPGDTLLGSVPLTGTAGEVSLPVDLVLAPRPGVLGLLATLELSALEQPIENCKASPSGFMLSATNPGGRPVLFGGGSFSPGAALTCTPRYLVVDEEGPWTPQPSMAQDRVTMVAFRTQVRGSGNVQLMGMSLDWTNLVNAVPTTVRLVEDVNRDWRASPWEPVLASQAFDDNGNMLSGGTLAGEQRLLLTVDIPSVAEPLAYSARLALGTAITADAPVVEPRQKSLHDVTTLADSVLATAFLPVAQTPSLLPNVLDGTVADLDGNGYPEVLALGTDGAVLWFANPDGNRFSAPVTLLQDTAAGPMGIHMLDVDRDAQDDVVVVHAAGADVFRGQGGNVFLPPTTVTFQDPPLDRRAVAFADVVLNGWPDLVVAGSSGVTVHPNVNGVFQAPLSAVAFSGGPAREIRLVDLDRNGALDALVRVNAQVHWLEGNGMSLAASASYGLTAPGNSNGGLLAADFNLDGYVDLLAPGADNVELLAHAGSATNLSIRFTDQALADPRDVLLLDLRNQGDILPDLLLAGNGLAAWRSSSNAVPVSAFGAGGGTLTGFRRLVAADVNLDGRPDAVMLGTPGTPVQLALVGGTPRSGNQDEAGAGFAAPVPVMGITGSVLAMTHADFNRDGWEDVAFADSTGTLAVALHDRNAGVPAFTVSGTVPGRDFATLLTTADWTGDGIPDVVHYRVTNFGVTWVEVFAVDANGALVATPVVEVSIGFDEGAVDLDVGDLDRDGLPDILLAHTTNPGSGVLSVILNAEGTSRFFAGTSLYITDAELVDVDGPAGRPDGSTDVVQVHGMPDQLVILQLDANGDAGAEATVPLPCAPRLVRAGRLQRAARTGLLLACEDGKVLSVVHDGMAWNVVTETGATLAGAPRALLLGDTDNDGDTDAVIVHAAGMPVLEVLTNRNTLEAGHLEGGVEALGTRSVAAGIRPLLVDLDRDGDLDVLTAAATGLEFYKGH